MKLKYFAVKEEVQKQRMFISIKFMIADPLSKGLLSNMFNDHVNRMVFDRNP